MVDEDRIDRLERLVEQQAETIAALQEQVATLAEDASTPSVEGDGSTDASESATADRAPSDHFSRRSILGAAAALGLGGYATGSASAAAPRGVAGSSDHPVDTLYLDTLSGPLTGGADLTTLAGGGLAIEDGSLATAGDGLTITENGHRVAENPSTLAFGGDIDVVERDDEIDVSVSDQNTQTDVSDDGTTVVESTGDVDFGANLEVTDDGDGSATVDADVQGATNWTEADSDDLLEPESPFSGIDVGVVETDSLGGNVAGGTDVTDLRGDGLSVSNGSLGLAADSVTVAGNSVSLGGSTTVDHTDLNGLDEDQHHAKDHDHTEAEISAVPNGGLANDSVRVAGNAVSLGGSTSVDHGDLDGISDDQHHAKDHDHTEAEISAVPNGGLANDSVRVTGGDGLTGGGSVDLGESTTLDVDPAQFAGNALVADGNSNLAVSGGGIGRAELAFDALENPGQSSTLSPGFDNWVGAHSSRPSWVEIEVYVETDGTDGGSVYINYSDDGMPYDDGEFVCFTSPELGAHAQNHRHTLYLPPGGLFELENFSDPTGRNEIQLVRAVVG